MTFFNSFKRSAAELKDVRCIAVTAVLIALDLVLKSFCTITVTKDLKISFAFLALASVGMLYGPVVSLMAGTVTDLIGFFLTPNMGAFNPMYTVIEAAGAMIYGLYLYNLRFSGFNKTKKFTTGNDLKGIMRIVLAKVTVIVVCNLLLTPLANIITRSMEAGALIYAPTLAAYPARVIKNLIQCPVDCVLLAAVLPVISMAYNSVFKKTRITVND